MLQFRTGQLYKYMYVDYAFLRREVTAWGKSIQSRNHGGKCGKSLVTSPSLTGADTLVTQRPLPSYNSETTGAIRKGQRQNCSESVTIVTICTRLLTC
jgi:hypothetical protein